MKTTNTQDKLSFPTMARSKVRASQQGMTILQFLRAELGLSFGMIRKLVRKKQIRVQPPPPPPLCAAAADQPVATTTTATTTAVSSAPRQRGEYVLDAGAVVLYPRSIVASHEHTDASTPPSSSSSSKSSSSSSKSSSLPPSPPVVHVLYKDADVLVVNKPAGMPSQGGTGVAAGVSLADNLHSLSFDYKRPPKLVQ
jgi:23S rRNA-/tRNA-specific pseudouridylate synthase